MTPLTPWLLLVGSILAVHSVTALHGRFLTLSDLHADWNYVDASSLSKACHRGKHPKRKDTAGYWGSPVSDCDSPASLIDSLMHELECKWKDKVDFVILMGDFARHDLDSNIPRTLDEIVSLNANLTTRLSDIFTDVPIVPSIGNNDVFPHNIMRAGPSKMTASISKVWSNFIPEEQWHTFSRGGYYAREVVPGKLVVVSLNTILWFNNNKVVDGCPAPQKGRTIDPGMEQLRWLHAQLDQWREAGLQVILSGHVPPSDYYEGCYTKFAEMSLAFQDTIVASVYGHKNVDVFDFFQHNTLFASSDSADEQAQEEELYIEDYDIHASYQTKDLRSTYESLPKRPKQDDYAIWNIAPSVIPTYLPGYRLWSYNVSDYEDTYRASLFGPTLNSQLGEEELDFNANETDSPLKTYDTLAFLTQQILDFKTSNEVTPLDLDALKKKKKKHKKKHKKKKPSPSLPRHTSPDSPSRTNRFLTPLGYVQYYLPLDLPNMNDGWGPDAASFKSNHRPWPEWQIEYSTLDESRLHRVLDISSQSTTNTKVTTLDLPDLTIGSWLQFARQVAKNDKSWNKYERRIYVSSGA